MGKDISRFLSLVLRHKPETIGLKLDKAGWVDVDILIAQLAINGKIVSREEIERIVATNDKKRYVLSEDGRHIMAAQGHSVDVDLQLKEEVPPDILYHGTVEKYLGDIVKTGLQKMSRHHVHLSKDNETAVKVGSRRGTPVILQVEAKRMHDDGFGFYISENGVWLTDRVPQKYIIFS